MIFDAKNNQFVLGAPELKVAIGYQADIEVVERLEHAVALKHQWDLSQQAITTTAETAPVDIHAQVLASDYRFNRVPFRVPFLKTFGEVTQGGVPVHEEYVSDLSEDDIQKIAIAALPVLWRASLQSKQMHKEGSILNLRT